MANFGKAVGDFLGFDPTPGFNLGYRTSGGNFQPAITGTGVNPRTGKKDPAATKAPAKKTQAAKVNSSGPANPTSLGYGGGASSVDPSILSQYDTAIGTTQSALGRLPGQLNIARGNIQSQYGTNLNEINSAKKQAQSSYDTSNLQNKQGFRSDKNQIADTASAGLRGLLRTLGAYGAGGSSDAMYVAPQAVAEEASIQRAGAGENYAQNAQTLDTNWGNFQTEDETSRKKLADWRTQQMNSAEAQSSTTKQDLLSKLADLMGQKAAYQGGDYKGAAQPYISQADALSSRIDSLGRLNPTYTGTTPTYEAPSLGSYDVNPNATVGVENAGQAAASPYLSLLLGNREREQQQVF